MSGAGEEAVLRPPGDLLRLRELVTPEGVPLRLVLGEASERASAFLLDAFFIIGILVVATLVIVAAGYVTDFRPGEILTAVWLLASFVLRNFYFMYFEMGPRAATPGKRLLGLRVAARNGRALTAEAVFARNAMRELEVYFPLSFMIASANSIDSWINVAGLLWCAVFIFFPLFNRDRLRAGDLVGGTWVVRVPKRVLDVDLSTSSDDAAIQFTRQQLDAYGIRELTVLEDVLRRRHPETMRAVAERIKSKIGIVTLLPDGEFLFAYYKALRRHLEQHLLFGRRRRDKFDKG
jgi:uncharacterized RDD family membrane protein YckC